MDKPSPYPIRGATSSRIGYGRALAVALEILRSARPENKEKWNPMRLQDKVALITGSAGGMGQAAAELFAREGASIIVTDIAADAGEQTARNIRKVGGKAIFVQANVANEDDVQHLVRESIDAFGRIDVLYNNAGIMPADDGGATDLTEAVWD